MKYITDIPNPNFKIGLYAWNGKHIIKVETQFYEQTYKISDMDFMGNVEDLKQLVADEDFILKITTRFQQMHQDFQTILEAKDII